MRKGGAVVATTFATMLVFTAISLAVVLSVAIYAVSATSFLSDDDAIYEVERQYCELEAELKRYIENIENIYPNYDEYKYNVAEIGHNPYELISYLTVMYGDFDTDAADGLKNLFYRQYSLSISEKSVKRYSDDGEKYIYRILTVSLENHSIGSDLEDDDKELYLSCLMAKGNREYLFSDDIYSNADESVYSDYSVSKATLSDENFGRLIDEAQKYLGYPYVWGGSNPSTSFDCSGFVCWVYKNSGVYPLERTTAQGIFNKCTPVSRSEVRPGDLIFFTGTYKSGTAVSHVGIYVGENVMLHCGNPIQYVRIDTEYWRKHFYAFGRLK